MVIVKVTFQIPKEMDLKTLKGMFQETAPLYQDTKGLIRKNYICDLDKSIGGGIYSLHIGIYTKRINQNRSV